MEVMRQLIIINCVKLIVCYSLGRVMGGDEALDKGHPYQASLRIDGQHICGGSIINNHWILTAAHCLAKHDAMAITVVLGTNHIVDGGEAYHVERVEIYPQYVLNSRIHDIGLIKVAEFIEFSESIQPIQLPSQDVVGKNCTGIFTGWGSTVIGSSNTDELRVIELEIIEWWICQRTFPSVGPGHLCTISNIGQGLCYGDSGSPLVSDNIQIAIGSWGSPCAQGYPDVHTRIYYYIDWIKAIIRE